MQGMLDNLSQPVAFATVPLSQPGISTSTSSPDKTDDLRRDGSLSSDTDLDEPIFSKFTRRIGMTREESKSGSSGSNRKLPNNQPEQAKPSLAEYDEDLEEGYSFSRVVLESDSSNPFFPFKGTTIYQDLST